MKNLLKVACIAALLILASCSPKSKSNAIWFKVSDEGHEQFKDYKKEGEWYVIKLAQRRTDKSCRAGTETGEIRNTH